MRRAIGLLPLAMLSACANRLAAPGSAPAIVYAPATVRVAFDRAGITGVRARGLADRGARRPATANDPVRIASISKLIVTLGVMRLAEAGGLDLDADVSGPLGFPLRNPAFPGVPITLRLLLSHRSSITDGIDYALPFDVTLRRALADPGAWDAAHAPGGFFRYANLNFPVVAAVMERATGERFDRLMRRLVFAPLRLDACLNWSGCSGRAIAHAVVLYGADGAALRDDLHGRPPPCAVVAARDGSCDLTRWVAGANGASFSPQGGVRISTRDLATIGRLLLGDGSVDGRRFLAPASIAAMTRGEWAYDGANGDPAGGIYCAYGLGVELIGALGEDCGDDVFGDGRMRIGHAGDAYGIKSGLWIDRARGTGVAYFTTAVAPDAPHGRSSWTAAEEAVAQGRR